MIFTVALLRDNVPAFRQFLLRYGSSREVGGLPGDRLVIEVKVSDRNKAELVLRAAEQVFLASSIDQGEAC